MKRLIDENVPHRIVERLRLDGHSLTLAQDVAAIRQDTDELALAHVLSAIVLTEDTDFGELVMHQRLPSAGVILLRLSGMARAAQPEHVAQILAVYTARIPGSFTVIAPAGSASGLCQACRSGSVNRTRATGVQIDLRVTPPAPC
jgi:predicted nuclease of predicted toxin-antitoxin system